MLFEMWTTWEEEKLGLISGISFVLIGVFGYLLYIEGVGPVATLFLALAMASAGGTAVLFQLPRIKGTRAAISTFLGGIMIGLAIILLVVACSMSTGPILTEAIVFTAMTIEVLLAFFAIGFLMLALYPEEILPSSLNAAPEITTEKKTEKRETSSVEIDDDLFERL